MPIQLVELIKLVFVGVVQGRSIIEIESLAILVPQGVELRCRHQGIVNGIEGLPGNLSGTDDIWRSPMPSLPSGGDGPDFLGIHRVRGALDPFP